LPTARGLAGNRHPILESATIAAGMPGCRHRESIS